MYYLVHWHVTLNCALFSWTCTVLFQNCRFQKVTDLILKERQVGCQAMSKHFGLVRIAFGSTPKVLCSNFLPRVSLPKTNLLTWPINKQPGFSYRASSKHLSHWNLVGLLSTYAHKWSNCRSFPLMDVKATVIDRFVQYCLSVKHQQATFLYAGNEYWYMALNFGLATFHDNRFKELIIFY